MTTDLGPRGQRLMASLTARDASLNDKTNPMREVALTAAATADRVDRLEKLAAEVEPWLETKAGMSTHPVLVEVRQQAMLLARLVAALRLPDPLSGKRPQHRQLRGVQTVSGSMSALERMRQRAEGA